MLVAIDLFAQLVELELQPGRIASGDLAQPFVQTIVFELQQNRCLPETTEVAFTGYVDHDRCSFSDDAPLLKRSRCTNLRG